ncbi:MAG: leucine-rich repeat domain-containing protein, partial [Clostridia bacterium]
EAIDLNNANLVIEIPEKTTTIYTEKWADYAKFMVEENPFIINGTILSGYTGIGGDLVLPEGITEIANNALSSNGSITSIIMPSSLIKIGEKAFAGCINLQRVIMPDSVLEIGESVFSSCGALNYIEFSKNITVIPDSTFEKCLLLQHFEISEKVTTLGNFAFCSSGLLEVVIPATVKDIGMYTFFESRLKSIVCYADIIHAMQTFGKLLDLETVDFYGKIGSIDGYDFSESAKVKVVNFHNDVATIENFTFDKMLALETVNFYGNISKISELAFNNCPILETVMFYKNIGTIEYSTYDNGNSSPFAGCPKLTKFSVSADNEFLTVDEYGVLYNKEMTHVIATAPSWDYDGTYVMPNTVETIAPRAFIGPDWYLKNFEYTVDGGWTATAAPSIVVKPNLKGVVLSGNLKEIGKYCFWGYNVYEDGGTYDRGFKNIKSITSQETTTDNKLVISQSAFEYSINLEILELPTNTVKIERFAFANCPKLTKVVLPEGVELIGVMSFGYCTALTEVVIPSTLLPLNFGIAFTGCTSLTKYTISESNPYFNIENETIFDANHTIIYSYIGEASEYVIPEGVIYIMPNAFMYNETLECVTFPTTLKAIGDKAFYGTTKLLTFKFLSKEAPKLQYLYDIALEGRGMTNFYANFVDYFDYVEYLETGLTIYYPEGGNYTNYIWRNYFINKYSVNEAGEAIVVNTANQMEVTNMIGSLNMDTLSIEDKATIETIRKAYDLLTDEEKLIVSNANTLLLAEETISKLEKGEVVIPKDESSKPSVTPVIPDEKVVDNKNNNIILWILGVAIIGLLGNAIILKTKRF